MSNFIFYLMLDQTCFLRKATTQPRSRSSLPPPLPLPASLSCLIYLIPESQNETPDKTNPLSFQFEVSGSSPRHHLLSACLRLSIIANRPKLPTNRETWNEERPAKVKQKKKTIPPQPQVCSLNHLNINDNSLLNTITMSLQTAGDIPILISSENSGSERRITPSWTIGQLKAKLEPVTGIPPLSQKLLLKRAGQPSLPIEANDEENTQLAAFPLAPYSEILVSHVSVGSALSIRPFMVVVSSGETT